MTYPDILNWGIKVHNNSIFPLGFLTSRGILYDSTCVYTNFLKTLPFFYCPPSLIVLKVYCTLLMAHTWKMFCSDYYGFQSQEKKYDSNSLKTFKRRAFSDNFTVETDDVARISLWKDNRSVTNISSEYTSLIEWRRSPGVFTLSAHTFNT